MFSFDLLVRVRLLLMFNRPSYCMGTITNGIFCAHSVTMESSDDTRMLAEMLTCGRSVVRVHLSVMIQPKSIFFRLLPLTVSKRQIASFQILCFFF